MLLDEMYGSEYRMSCRESLAALISHILASCVNTKMIHKRLEDTNHEQPTYEHPTSSMAPLLLLLPDSQFLY